jgi:hypothetical protein
MILTFTAAFGDFIPSLIISNYYYKNEKEKTTFVLSSWFKKIVGIEEFLMNQEFTEKVVFDPHMPERFDMGGQPYKFKPVSVEDENYYNLGFREYPNKYLGEFYAEEYDLKFDKDINLKFIDENFPEEYRNLKVYSHFHEDRWDKERYEITYTKILPEQMGFIPLDITKPLLHNLNVVHYSKENSFYPNGFSVLLDICKVNFSLTNGSVNPNVYYMRKK